MTYQSFATAVSSMTCGLPEEPGRGLRQDKITHRDESRQQCDPDEHDHGGSRELLAVGPADLLQLLADLGHELSGPSQRLHEMAGRHVAERKVAGAAGVEPAVPVLPACRAELAGGAGGGTPLPGF